MSNSGFYVDFFNLRERPFTLLPDPDFLFWTEQHRAAFSVLQYGLMSRAPITVITGEVGAGKTTLLRKFLTEIPPDTTVALISNAQGNRGELLQWILNALDQPFSTGSSYVELFQQLLDFTVEQYAQGRRVALIIDEAQHLSVEGLEELRMLTNINSGKDELLQLVLIGQPELRDLIRRPELRQFAQRVAANYHLPSLTAEVTAAYIGHRLRQAGGTGNEFTAMACERIHQATRGIPRLINQLADFSMVYALPGDEPLVLASTVDSVIKSGLFFSGFGDDEPQETVEPAADSAPAAADLAADPGASPEEEDPRTSAQITSIETRYPR